MASENSTNVDLDLDLLDPGLPDNNRPLTERSDTTCVLCGQSLNNGQKTLTQTARGVEGLQKASRRRGERRQDFYAGQTLHVHCRHEYCNTFAIERDLRRQQQQSSPKKKPSLRSSQSQFNFADNCLLCGKSVKNERKKGNVWQVRTPTCQANLENVCMQRGPGDKWAQTVKGRIEYAQDLFAADAVYHQQCSVNFRTGKNVPKAFTSSPDNASRKGRPGDEKKLAAFEKVISYLKDNDDEQLTVSDLCHKMSEYMEGEEPYTKETMKKKLQKTVGDDIIITNQQGKMNTVTFRVTADKILDQFWKMEKATDTLSEKQRIIETAANLILIDIKAVEYDKDEYPTREEVSDVDANVKYLPSSLSLFLQTLVRRKKDSRLKIASIGQALMSAVRPTSLLTPLQLGLGVQTHHLFGSREHVDQLHKLGFCPSYNEVQCYEKSAASSQGTDLLGIGPHSISQFIADNVDHNLRTLEGSGTFHGMGIIGAVTPGENHSRVIHRDTSITTGHTSAVARIPIHYYNGSKTDLSLRFEELQDFSFDDITSYLDLLWKVSWPLRAPRPNWSGTMQLICDGKYPGQSTVTFLPMIDMQPTDMSCVYSTLHFVSNLATRHKIQPILTFDQPLWWKSQLIIDNEPINSPLRSIILRLGGFHVEMSFLGSIGHLMAGSGLQQLFQVIYAQDAVVHMLSGKAVSRAVRAHFLVDSVLNALLSSIAFNFCLPTAGSEERDRSNTSHDIEQTSEAGSQEMEVAGGNTDTQDIPYLSPSLQLFDQLLEKEVSPEVVASSQELQFIEQKLAETKSKLMANHTSRLWIQYMDMLDILRKFLKGERTGNWGLHLHAMKEMLPYLAASGHFLYTKSVYIYLQQMQGLQEKHPEVFRAFQDGYHVLRRSDRYWAGLSTDLVIEQTLMRSVKSTGGLTRGRGMGESQRSQWLLSRPACADMNAAMQEVTGCETAARDQHPECSLSRQRRDDKDMLSLLGFLQTRNPFQSDETSALRSISTGTVADNTVNADNAKEVGNAIVQSMRMAAVKDFKFKKKDQVVTMGLKSSAKVDGEPVQVDPQLLFQRLVTVANGLSEELDLPSIFQYDLSCPPASLFEASGLMRDSNKAQFADALMSVAFQGAEQPNAKEVGDPEDAFVIDGGSLLHRIPWRKNDTFLAIIQTYVDYVKRTYTNPHVVFDGYNSGPSTKDAAHFRRSHGVVGPRVRFTPEMVCSARKENFLANEKNKETFVQCLGDALEKAGCQVSHANGDADTLIASTAVSCALHKTTVVIGEDTDLLVLLLFHSKFESKPIILKSELKSKKHKKINILSLKSSLGPQICQYIPFLHAVNGCDTTSRLFGVGKSQSLKKFKTDANFRMAAETFCARGQRAADIIAAGEKALVSLYGGRTNDSLDILRYIRFCEKVSTTIGPVQVRSLPPTSSAARYHSLRVYLQVQYWIDSSSDLQPEQWGWCLNSGRLEPCTTDLPPAPEALLNVIRCKCKTDCRSQRCSCRKHGLECSLACGECKGLSCSNSPSPEPVDDILEQQDDNLTRNV